MKKIKSIQAIITLMLVFSFPVIIARAQMAPENNFSVIENAFQFSITIPQEWNSYIVREDATDMAIFSFKKGDGSKVFLFSVSRAPEDVWLKIKDQLNDYHVLDRKNGNFYYSQYTDRTKLKGDDNKVYSQIYLHLDDLMKSIKITE